MRYLKVLFFILSFCALSSVTFAGATFHYVVKGKINGQEGKTIKMTDYGRNSEIIDSATVKNGAFMMEGDYDRHGLVRVECGRLLYSNCILDTLTVPDFETHLPEPSTPLNRQYRNYHENLDVTKGRIMERAVELQNNPALSDEEKNERFNKFREEIYPELKTFFTDIIINHPDGIGEDALWFGLSDIEITPYDWEEIYSVVPKEIKELPLTLSVNNKYLTMKTTLPGAMFVDVEGQYADGSAARLSDYVGKDKYVLVDFWASWCGPCIEEGENYLKPLFERYKGVENFEIVGVATWDDIEKTKQCIERRAYKWPQILDAGQQPLDLYGFIGIPMIMLFGPDGVLLERDLRGPEIEKSIRKYINIE